MTKSRDETTLVTQLCTQILAAPQLKTLCRARGFPITGTAKDALAHAVAPRFLEATGVASAMAALDPAWLRVLYLAAAADEPLSLRTVARATGRLKKPYDRVDYHGLWNVVLAGFVSAGVVLVVDAPSITWDKSRYARFHLVLPDTFARHLPPFPLEAEPVRGRGHQGDLDDVLSSAFTVLVEGDRARAVARPIVARAAARLALKDGHLSFGGIAAPDATRIAHAVKALWVASLKIKGQKDQGDETIQPGPLALLIVGGLAAGTGCSAAALTTALEGLGVETEPPAVDNFLADGAAAGFLMRFERTHAASLYRAGAVEPTLARETLRLAKSAAGTKIVLPETGFLPLLQVASVARALIVDETLVMEPDPVRLGRGWHDLPESIRNTLATESRAFHDVSEQLEKRAGKVIVHRGLAVLRVDDAGLHALLLHRLGEWVRPLDEHHLACLDGKLSEVLAFARKEGYVARRSS